MTAFHLSHSHITKNPHLDQNDITQSPISGLIITYTHIRTNILSNTPIFRLNALISEYTTYGVPYEANWAFPLLSPIYYIFPWLTCIISVLLASVPINRTEKWLTVDRMTHVHIFRSVSAVTQIVTHSMTRNMTRPWIWLTLWLIQTKPNSPSERYIKPPCKRSCAPS